MSQSIKKLIFVIIGVFILAACQNSETSFFTDEKLESALREQINILEEELSSKDLEGITEADLSESNITSLDGIQALKNIEKLYLQDNQIQDFSILEELENLTEVNVSNNPGITLSQQQEILQRLSKTGVTVLLEEGKENLGKSDGPGGYLWKVENGDTVVYLQGTIHVGTEDLFPLHEKIEQAYLDADVVVPEIDIVNIDLSEVQRETMKYGVYGDGSTLKDHISEELYSETKSVLNNFGLPIEILEMYKPWMLSSTIESLMKEELGFIYGVDEYFLTRAHEDGKEIIDLETIEDQFSIFANTSPEYQADMLKAALIDINEFNDNLTDLLNIYMEGDPDKLRAAVIDDEAEPTEEDIAFLKALNDDRNYNMADKIIQFLEDDTGQTYFVIVGSAHLILEPHIISILKEHGYEAEHVH